MYLEEHAETVGMLAATIAHEVKNPLALILANIDFLELCDEEKKFSKNYAVMREELKKTNVMLAGFMELLHDACKFDEDIAMYDIVMNVAENYKRSLSKRLSIHVACEDKNLHFKGNFQLFTICLSNVIKNAAEAIEASKKDGKGVIDIVVMDENDAIRVEVKDSGTGISEEAMTHINAGKPYTTKTSGGGIGINICRNIIRQHGGSYEIKNGIGGGCVVTLRAPKT